MNFIKNINWNLVKSIVRRDLRMYFTNPTGYVFITLFVFLSATAAFWQDRFFLNNLANLDQLNALFPYLLLFFIPALTMGVWADENKQGTDELLLTLPATDFEIVLGKYAATLGIYSASLIFSILHVVVLMFLGSPDIGLMIGNYFGYWLAGAALISVGMLASLLTANVTISFILGALFCGFFVFIDNVAGIFGDGFQNFVRPIAIFDHFGDFAKGVVSFSGLLYFLSITAVMLYLNVTFLSRRHWPNEADGYKMWIHHLVRGVALVLAVISFNAVLARLHMRLDVTAEQLHSLSGETQALLDNLPDDRTVFIQAFISPDQDVPQQYVQTKQNLLSFLREIDAEAGGKVEVQVHETEPYTSQAKDAREKFGINPVEVPDLNSTRAASSKLFMGVAFTSGAEEQVIPFFDRGLPAEYELTRSIRVVAGSQRKKIGVLNTEAKLFGGFDFQTMNSSPEWQVVQELKKQYDVVQIAASAPITEELDGLLAVLPSSLPQEEMDNLQAYIETGAPTLLLVDPLPVVNIGLSPSERAGANKNPFQQNQGPPPKPKGNIQGLLSKVGVNWNIRQVTWDAYNPHPELAGIPPEVVFVGQGNQNPESFSKDHSASSGLQEIVLLYPGSLRPGMNGVEFTPLLKSSLEGSGSLMYQQLVQRSFFGTQMVDSRRIPHRATPVDFVFAAQVKGEIIDPAANGESDSTSAITPPKTVNAIVISDLDFISEQFFEIRKRGIENLNFDNISFFLNCMDHLVGDESFVELRKRRVRHRTLTTLERQVQDYNDQRTVEESQAESEAQLELAEAQSNLDTKVAEVRNRTDIDERSKEMMARNLQEAESRKFEVRKANIEAEKEAKVAASKENMEGKIRGIQSTIRTLAVLLPPIPVFIIGLMTFVKRQRRENEAAAEARKLRS